MPRLHGMDVELIHCWYWGIVYLYAFIRGLCHMNWTCYMCLEGAQVLPIATQVPQSCVMSAFCCISKASTCSLAED
jgi:hypothetical protein